MAAEPKFDLTKVRNIGVIAHIDAGKTTTTDHLLYYSGAKHNLGEVDKGTTTTDYDQEEQDRGITIYSACVPFQWRDCTINLIDTPGHVDFTAEVERSLRVLDGAVVVFDAQKGVEAQSETVWRQADKYQVPRLVFVNKMDVVGANFANAIAEIVDRLEGKPVPVVIPIGAGSIKDSSKPLSGVIDLLEMKALFFDPKTKGMTFRTEAIPDDMTAEAQRWRENLFEVLTQKDDGDRLTSAYLEGQDIPTATIRAVLREQTLARLIQPVLCGSGREHVGIQPLLDAVCWYLPSPLDRPPVVGKNPKKKDAEEQRKPDPKEPFCGLVFKVVSHPSGERGYVRVYSGLLKGNSRLYNPRKDYKENVGKFYHVHADPMRGLEEIPQAVTGDIVCFVGMKESVTGDTLCDTHHPIALESIQFAEAVVSQSIEPESSGDKDKLAAALTSLQREDPTYRVKVDPDTGQTLMSGMGVLHLEIKKHRLERDFNLQVRVSKPRVSYRETLRSSVEVVGECIRHAGTANLFGKVKVRFDKTTGGQGVVVRDAVPPDVLSAAFVAAAEQGVRNALLSGELGYPVIDVQATLLGGEMDEQLSSDIAFVAAGSNAVHQALKDNMVLLEPVMYVEVVVPEEYLGGITGDLSARRAEIKDTVQRGKLRQIEAIIPLSKMFDYSDKVRSLSQGRASWTMEPHDYREVPPEVVRAMLNPEGF